jgi:hypothetical protein
MALQFSLTPIIPELPVVQAKSLLVIKVKDAPAELQELFIEIDEVRVHRVLEEEDGESPWLNVTVHQTDPFDLLLLEDFAIVLATSELPVGEYTEIRLHVQSAYANISDQEELVPLRVVANGWLMVKANFTLGEKNVTTVVVDIQVNETPIIRAKILHPVVKATVEAEGVGASETVQTNYRWADDTDPFGDWKAGENMSITDVAITGDVLRLRLAINNTGEATWSEAQLKLQYTNETVEDWTDVGAGQWLYFNGNGTDGSIIDDFQLSGSTVKEHFVESSPTAIIVDIPVDGQGEWDICIVSDDADPDETYYFRFVLADGTPLDDYIEYPTLTTASAE